MNNIQVDDIEQEVIAMSDLADYVFDNALPVIDYGRELKRSSYFKKEVIFLVVNNDKRLIKSNGIYWQYPFSCGKFNPIIPESVIRHRALRVYFEDELKQIERFAGKIINFSKFLIRNYPEFYISDASKRLFFNIPLGDESFIDDGMFINDVKLEFKNFLEKEKNVFFKKVVGGMNIAKIILDSHSSNFDFDSRTMFQKLSDADNYGRKIYFCGEGVMSIEEAMRKYKKEWWEFLKGE